MPGRVIRKHGISSGQLYSWRQQLATRIEREPARSESGFARVDVVSAPELPDKVDLSDNIAPMSRACRSVAAPLNGVRRAKGVIEIVLSGGVLVRIDGRVDVRLLRQVLDVFVKR
jgi:transposase-like protein